MEMTAQQEMEYKFRAMEIASKFSSNTADLFDNFIEVLRFTGIPVSITKSSVYEDTSEPS